MRRDDRSKVEPAATQAPRPVNAAELPVARLMGRPPLTVGLNTALTAALRLFTGYGVRHLVVIDETGKCAGLLTDRAVAAQWAAHPLAFERFTVAAVYASGGECVRPGSRLGEAAQVMRQAGIDAVVVTDDSRRPVGIVTASDLVASLAEAPTERPEA